MRHILAEKFVLMSIEKVIALSEYVYTCVTAQKRDSAEITRQLVVPDVTHTITSWGDFSEK